jgi:hypothetical protein
MPDYQWQQKRDKAVKVLREMPEGAQFLLSTEFGMLSIIHELNLMISSRSFLESLIQGLSATPAKQPSHEEPMKKCIGALTEASAKVMEAIEAYNSMTVIILPDEFVKKDDNGGKPADA